ncbi:DUF1360 domain-containing protein [Bacillus sp. LL01]|uniref:DUF1360 domain-containing protein n=1 Tax=Bacillus sp. LL01 TaxID=1665556 RepID=UPI001F5199A1|nr:DUF1360 domain-containing protein [Bacillus sp. LL01]
MAIYSLSVYEFILLALAVFRLTHLLVFDEITEFIRKPFQELKEERDENGETFQYFTGRGKGIQRFIGDVLSCYWCTGIWAAIFLYVGFIYFPMVFVVIVYIFALAGVAAFIETAIKRLNH